MNPGLSILDALRGGFAPTDLFQLPTRQITFDENDSRDIIFKKFLGICVDLEVENTDASNPMTYTVDSLDARVITLGGGVAKGHSRVITRSVHIKTIGSGYVIRCAVVDIFQALNVPGVEL